MGTYVGPGIGSRLRIEYVNEATWGTMPTGAVLGATGQAMLVTSESIKNAIGELVSNNLTPDRSVSDTLRGNFDISGDLAFEYGPDAGEKTLMVKHAMCRGASATTNYVKIQGALGHLGMQVRGTQLAAVADLILKGPASIFASWAATGTVVIVNRTAAGVLSTAIETYTAKASTPNGYHTLTIVAPPGKLASHLDGAWAFPIDAVNWNATYLHYMELGRYIGDGITLDILRDLSLFVYTGMKVNTWTMNFNAGEIITGTFSLLGREEDCGGRLIADKDNTAGPTTLNIDDIRIFNDGLAVLPSAIGGTLLIGHEGEIAYTGIAAGGLTFPAGQLTGVGTIALGVDPTGAVNDGYFRGTPVSPMDSRANNAGARVNLYTTTILDIPAYTAFEGAAEQQSGLYGGTAIDDAGCQIFEIINATFTLDNGLYTDKFVFGSRYRAKLPEQKRNVTGTLSLEFDNILQYRKFVDGTPFGFILRLISQDIANYIVNTGDDMPHSSCFYFHKCKYTGETPNAGGPDIMTTDMPFRSMSYIGRVSSPAILAGDSMPFTELTFWVTTSRTADLWA